tara:strand:+ start:263 stop:1657 length:1395 start_codon:yes stop_codon:yes gene_type:complete
MGYVSPSAQFYKDLFEEHRFTLLILEGKAKPSFKYDDEHAHVSMWNHVVKNSKMRKAIEEKDFDTVHDWIEDEIEDSINDKDHPLNFNQASESGFKTLLGTTGILQGTLDFSKKFLGKKRPEHKDHYDQRMGESVWGIMALIQSREGSQAAEKGLPARLTGKSKVKSNKPGWEGKDRTKKRDWEIYDEKNPKFGIGISQKDLGGSQLMSAEAAQTRSTLRAGAKNYANEKLKSGEWTRRQATEFKKRVESDAKSVGDDLDSMKTANRSGKKSIRDTITNKLNTLATDYKGFNASVGSETASGEQQFGKSVSAGSGGAQIILKTGGPNASVQSTRKKQFDNPMRGALPKGEGRPGNVKQDEKKQEYGTPPERRPRPTEENPNQLNINLANTVKNIVFKGVENQKQQNANATNPNNPPTQPQVVDNNKPPIPISVQRATNGNRKNSTTGLNLDLVKANERLKKRGA